MSQQINALPINGITIADLALLAPGPGQFLEVGGATEGRIDIEALAAYARSPAFGGDANTATITTNNVVRSQIDISGNVSSTIPGGSTLLPEFKCRAWVNFDGSTTLPTIRGSGNVASVTRVGIGAFQVNFLTGMPDANYAAVGWCAQIPGQNTITYNFLRLPGSLGIQAVNFTGSGANSDFISVAVFR